jgi:tetratricopeptide (TPR) repeat protein
MRPPRRHRPTATAAAAILVLAGCASTPALDPDPLARLAEAEAFNTAGEPARCLDLLEGLGVEAFPVRLRDRYDVALATAHLGLEEPWDAWLVLEPFADRHPFSELEAPVSELLWQAARALSGSDRAFLFFWSDRRGAQTVAEHLVARHPECNRLADALRLLGDLAYEDGNYELARERFRDLLRRRPKSSWETYSRFRFAMSIHAGLVGPDYDRSEMETASRELTHFLSTGAEDPRFVAEAKAALRQVMEWRSENHLRVAHFYRTIGNAPGQRLHLEAAARPEFEGTPAHAAAAAELTELPTPTNAPPAGGPAR